MKMKVIMGIVGEVEVTNDNKLVFKDNAERRILTKQTIAHLQNSFDQHCESGHLTITEAVVATAGNNLNIWRDEIEIVQPEKERAQSASFDNLNKPIQ